MAQTEYARPGGGSARELASVCGRRRKAAVCLPTLLMPTLVNAAEQAQVRTELLECIKDEQMRSITKKASRRSAINDIDAATAACASCMAAGMQEYDHVSVPAISHSTPKAMCTKFSASRCPPGVRHRVGAGGKHHGCRRLAGAAALPQPGGAERAAATHGGSAADLCPAGGAHDGHPAAVHGHTAPGVCGIDSCHHFVTMWPHSEQMVDRWHSLTT